MHVFTGPAALLDELRARLSGVAVALVSANGVVLGASLPPGIYAETLAVMCATAMGAAAAANRELGRTTVERVVVEGGDSRSVLLPVGSEAVLVIVLELGADVDQVSGVAAPLISRWSAG